MPVLPIILPLLIAAVLAAGDSYFPRRLTDILAAATSGGVAVISIILAEQTLSNPIVYWLGGWRPTTDTHFPLGICLVIDPLAAGAAALVSLLVFAGVIFSWHYFKAVQSYFHSIMLVFMAGMIGVCLSADLFNLFVFFELMTVAAVTLCGYKSQDKGPLQGALNFGVVNTLGAFVSLVGIGFVYAYTGTLNMAEAGRTLAFHPPGGCLLSIIPIFVMAGFLVKSATVPFQFWLPDAHSVAPTPVSVLFSGIMVELGLYAVFRIYNGVFAMALGEHAGFRTLLMLVGALTICVGGALCFCQRHLKRLLAFSTISHVGVMCLGLALNTPESLAGVSLYLLGHGLVKSALFLCTGILLHHFQTLDEFDLSGRGPKLYTTVGTMLLAALGLAGVPPFATSFGAELMHHQAHALGIGWISIFVSISGIFTTAAVIRVTVRLFWNFGEPQSPFTAGAPRVGETSETTGKPLSTPYSMWAPGMILILVSLLVAVSPNFREGTIRVAGHLIESHLFQNTVLTGNDAPPGLQNYNHTSKAGLWEPLTTLTLAVLLSLIGLYPSFIPRALRKTGQPLRASLIFLRKLHSGRVGDYVTFMIAGITIYAWILVLLNA